MAGPPSAMGGSRGTADGWWVSTVNAVTVVGGRVSESSDFGLMLRERPWRRAGGAGMLSRGAGWSDARRGARGCGPRCGATGGIEAGAAGAATVACAGRLGGELGGEAWAAERC